MKAGQQHGPPEAVLDTAPARRRPPSLAGTVSSTDKAPFFFLPHTSPYATQLPGLPGPPRALSTRGSEPLPGGSTPWHTSRESSAALLGATTASSGSLSKYSLASAAGNLSARGTAGLQWSVLHGRPVIGKDCLPEVGQRVVGVAGSAFRSIGLGTIVKTDGCVRGYAAVQWDRERGSARRAAEYCVGHNGVYLLELAQLEDIVLGQRYESINGGQGTTQARSVEDLFSQPVTGGVVCVGECGRVGPVCGVGHQVSGTCHVILDMSRDTGACHLIPGIWHLIPGS